MSFSDIGKSWSKDNLEEFRQHIKSNNIDWATKPSTLHHTASPSLAQRPNGLTDQHIRNIRDHYKNKLGWSSGPHFFVDEHRIMALSPIGARGVHAVSFNSNRIGIEVLGNYDSESPFEGRGLECWKLATDVVKIIGEESNNFSGAEFSFHRDDPKTSKTCPGKLVSKQFISDLLLHKGASIAPIKEMAPILNPVNNVFEYKGEIIAPISEIFRLLGKKNAYNPSSWNIDIVYYDQISRISYGRINDIILHP